MNNVSKYGHDINTQCVQFPISSPSLGEKEEQGVISQEERKEQGSSKRIKVFFEDSKKPFPGVGKLPIMDAEVLSDEVFRSIKELDAEAELSESITEDIKRDIEVYRKRYCKIYFEKIAKKNNCTEEKVKQIYKSYSGFNKIFVAKELKELQAHPGFASTVAQFSQPNLTPDPMEFWKSRKVSENET